MDQGGNYQVKQAKLSQVKAIVDVGFGLTSV